MTKVQTEIQTRIDRIKANYQNYHNARKTIIEDMLYLEKHGAELKKATGKTFAELKTELTGFSKRYFNQLVSNYKFLEQYGRLDLFDKIDVKAIEHVKKINKPELLDDPEKLTRRAKLPGDGLPLVDAEFIVEKSEETEKTPPSSAQDGPGDAQKAGDGPIPSEITGAVLSKWLEITLLERQVSEYELENKSERMTPLFKNWKRKEIKLLNEKINLIEKLIESDSKNQEHKLQFENIGIYYDDNPKMKLVK